MFNCSSDVDEASGLLHDREGRGRYLVGISLSYYHYGSAGR